VAYEIVARVPVRRTSASFGAGLFQADVEMPAVAVVEQNVMKWPIAGHAKTAYSKNGSRQIDCFPSWAHTRNRRQGMALDTDKIDDTALALLYLTLHDGVRAWKGMDWGVLDRLHDKGMIYDPVGKVKSVVFIDEGLERAKALFEAMFEK
jgi:hypothetical protein